MSEHPPAPEDPPTSTADPSAGPADSPARVELDPGELGAQLYPLLNSAVLPRPIAWVSSVDPTGLVNLAPHSFFTVAGVAPPTLLFSSIGTKDSLRNIRATGQFVVNVVSRELAEACNLTSTPFPPEVSELTSVGLHAEPSLRVTPPRVAESPVAFECRLSALHDVGGDCTVIFGEVVHVAVHASVLRLGQRPPVDLRALHAVSRLGADEWAEIGEVFTLRRLPLGEWEDLHRGGKDPRAAARGPRPDLP